MNTKYGNITVIANPGEPVMIQQTDWKRGAVRHHRIVVPVEEVESLITELKEAQL